MNIGDLVHDSTFGMNGVVIDELSRREVIKRWSRAEANFRVWTILYEDGQTDIAFDNELEVIS
jgi:hypothetical protein